MHTIASIKVVGPGHTVNEYARNVVALGEMEHRTAELFEPAGRVNGCRAMSLIPTLNQSAIFVGIIIGFLNVYVIRLVASS